MMKARIDTNNPSARIEHPGEPIANQLRARLQNVEPKGLRTFTPSLAVLKRAAGCYVWTEDDRKLLDLTSGVLVVNLGHHPTTWWQRVRDYLALPELSAPEPFLSMVPLTAYNAATEIEVLACERLLTNMQGQPGGNRMQQVIWSASGSEAIQKSLWAAMRLYPGRDMVLATRRGFHGKKGLADAVTGSEHDANRDPRVRFIAFPIAPCRDVERRREPLELDPYRQELEQAWDEFGDRIGCLITEPYLGGGGSYHPQPEYLQLLQEFCREHDIIFILDEIQSNFGRTGPMYAFTRYGVEPDIVCLGKGMANGIPVSAAAGRAEILATLDYGHGSDTWSANPLASAGVLATLDEFETRDVIGQGLRLSETLHQGLCRLKKTPAVAFVRGEGCVWGVECAGIGDHSANEVANACVEACYLGDQQGHAIHLLGPLAGNVLRVSPPLTTPIDVAEEFLDAMYGILSDLSQRLEKKD